MAVLNMLLAGAREIAVRSLELQARQETTTTIPTAETLTSLTATTPSSTPSSTGDSSSTTITPFPSNNPDNEPFKGNRDSTTSPLLFFVALGFGVVFTNLWIIVGVKYCFRYNARNRQLRMEAAGDPVALENMPRPHRRRREKKLMTMDEVNEKFPMQKYKNWVAARAQEGLPTMGGISAPPSRANSVRSVEGIAPEVPSKERDSDDQRPTTSASTKRRSDDPTSEEAKNSKDGKNNEQAGSSVEAGQAAGMSATMGDRSNLERVDSEDDNDDEHINAALPPECIGTSGDACAICIEMLEDDDDVRGLTCGHAFHAVCLDPWLTSRRACCPLCKADYYTPKPRPPPADANANADHNNGNVMFSQLRDSRRAPDSSRGFQPFVTLLPSRFRRARQNASQQMQQEQRPQSQRTGAQAAPRSPAQQQQASPTAAASETREAGSGNFFSNLRPSLPRVHLPRLPQLRRNRQGDSETAPSPTASGTNTAATPSQLEAGTRPVAVASA